MSKELIQKIWNSKSSESLHILTTGQILDYMGMGLVVGAVAMGFLILGLQ
jgi:hypothetical protein